MSLSNLILIQRRWSAFFILLSFSHMITLSTTFDIHISSFDPGGTAIVSISLGQNERRWVYGLGDISSNTSAHHFTSVNVQSGVVKLRRTIGCKHLSSNPFHLPIQITSSQRPSSYGRSYSVSLPFFIFVHGSNCPKHNNTAIQGHRLKTVEKSEHTIHIGFHNSSNVCFQPFQPVLSLVDFIPLSFRSCKLRTQSLTPNIFIQPQSLYIFFKDPVCITNKKHYMKVLMTFVCAFSRSGVQVIPYKFVLHKISSPSLPSSGQKVHTHGLRRQKRQVSNTAPVFDPNVYVTHVKEEEDAGTHVITITATDSDVGDAGKLTYRMDVNRDTRSQDMFSINPETGTIKTEKKLDRETMLRHYFTIHAIDNALPESDRLSATASLTIIVDDVNDHSPEFQPPNTNTITITIDENAGAGDIFLANAVDMDEGKNREIRYSILNPGPPNHIFTIDPKDGYITTRTSLDREEVPRYTLIIQAVDQGQVNKRKTSTMTLTVNVKDENDNKPIFTQENYTLRLKENRPFSRTKEILRINATDLDEGPNAKITYRLDKVGQSAPVFMIDRDTGYLYLIRSLDFEDRKQYPLIVRAEDQGVPYKFQSITVFIEVIDVNDNDPVFLENSYARDVDEDIGVDDNVLRVQAIDRDSDQNAVISYSIIQPSNGASLPFAMQSQTGWITVASLLDRELIDKYQFMVMAQDNGATRRSATASVTIGIRDVNDNPPKFKEPSYNTSISEEAKEGDPVIHVVAEDMDEGVNARVQYRIERGNDKDAFTIRMVHGEAVIVVNNKLDGRDQNTYDLTVSATGINGQTDSVHVVIHILDANRHAPELQMTDSFFSVSEDTPVDKSVFTVVALDKDRGDNARITYSLTPLSIFSIEPDTGIIRIRQKLDRETNPDYKLLVKATDNGKPPLSVEAEVSVTVSDVNDNAPEFSEDRYSGTVNEDDPEGTKIVQISALDKDKGVNRQIRYTFEGGDDGNGIFDVDTRGWIWLKKEVDREVKSSYDLIAVAKDSDPVSPQSSSVNIHIEVKDVNDNSPVFASSVFNVKIAENSPIGATVARIRAVDPDEGENALVEYSFGAGSDTDYFKLSDPRDDPAIITTLKHLDYDEGRQRFKVVLRASSDTRISTAQVFIQVQDINDNPPELENFSIIYNNFGVTFPEGPVGRVPAFDRDVSDRDRLVYKILSGNEAGLLSVNETSGEITLDPRLNSDVPREGQFQMSVSDGGTPVSAMCRLTVRLVTEDMLHHAVTIRLNKMTASAFLSDLLGYFTESLASIFGVEPRHVYVINVEDDTDVVPAQILNVSVSIRSGSGLVNGQTADFFHRPEYIREVIYLHRARLANLSNLQVLPFDDNLCLIEPCTNFELCRSIVLQGIAKPFISSKTVLFRPIHPMQIFTCTCPSGFAGMNQSKMCDTEIDLCYSNPCHNGGTCMRRESGYTCLCSSGFTGSTCDLNMTSHYDSLDCPAEQCQGQSVCHAIPEGGFSCQGCPQDAYHDKQCRLRSRMFQKGSYLTFPSLKARNRFSVQLKFATQARNGLLFYNGRFNGEHDFIALEIVESQVRFSFNLGSNDTTTITTNINGGVSTGQWTQVIVEYVTRVVTLSVGEDCDSEISIKYKDRLGSHPCAVRMEQELPDICDNPMKNCNRLLDLTGPLQLGSLPVSFNAEQFDAPDFEGCMSDVYLDHDLLDLDAAIANHLTTIGCPPKISRCHLFPCKKGGSCREGWSTFLCDCPERTGGKDCSQPIEPSRQFKGKSYMSYENFAAPFIRYPWLNGIAFRTRSDNGVIMQILLNSKEIVIELVKGYLYYNYDDLVIKMDMARVDDGHWHYFEVRWYKQGTIELFLDYEQHTKKVASSKSVHGKTIQLIYAGAYRDGGKPMSRFYIGCVKDIRVGNANQTYLVDPSMVNVQTGCSGDQVCDQNPCGAGKCEDLWNKHQCECPAGTIGPECKDICSNFDPCMNWAECKSTQEKGYSLGYKCECGTRQSGRYCEHQGPKVCPSGWWGKPVCGPCHCNEKLGFEEACNKDNGTCNCKVDHYLPAGSDTCYPCDCFSLGSTNLTCHPVTGQCNCHKTVVGRRCDQCDSIYAGVTWARKKVVGEDGKEKEIPVVTCLVSYDDCPRNHAEGIWWDEIAFGLEANQECPAGTTGSATRKCTQKDSWLKPDLFQCTSNSFIELEDQLNSFEANQVSPFSADYTIGLLKNITYTTSPIYGGDIMMTYRFTKVLLEYEISHHSLEMISQQYRDFVQKLLVALSNVTNNSYSDYWERVNKEMDGAGTYMVNLFERFVAKIVSDAPQAKSGTFEAVSGDIVLGTDFVNTDNFSGVTIPKYDNNVRKGFADREATVTLPRSLFSTTGDPSQVTGLDQSKAYIGYIITRDLAQLMTMNTDSSIRRTDRPMTVNGAILGLTIVHQGKTKVNLKDPINLRFRLRFPNNRTNMHCVRWVPSSTDVRAGKWTSSGCITKDTSCRIEIGSDRCEEFYVTCECNHLSSFAVIIDVADGTTLLPALIDMEVITYILTVISLLLLLLSFFALFTFKRLQCNWNSIHINLIFTVFIIQLAFLIGINRSSPELFCRLVAIALHFFYMSAFAWLFVEVLHMYRLLTEKQTINYGSMKFYYLLGYVLPGIVVGLAVGLYTEAYGNDSFCWLSTSDNFIWSFAGPVAITVVMILIAFFYAAKASYGKKSPLHDINAVRIGLLIALGLLLLLSPTWVIGLLSVNFTSLALHYIHSIFMFVDGLFIFLVYVAFNKKVRWCIKRFYYRLKGKKVEFEENNSAARNPVQSHRSALSYHHDSSTNGSGVRISNVGISTMSTVSRSSKGTSLAKSADILHSTSSSTSGGVTNINALYGFDTPFKDKIKEEGGDDHKGGGHDSDSDSDVSMDRHSLELASSHSSDDDDDFDIGPGWDNQMPQSRAVEMAREQIEKMRKEKFERPRNNNEDLPADSQGIEEIPETRSRSPPHFPMPSNPPDVTLTSSQRLPGLRPVVPPIRSDSLHHSPKPNSTPLASHTPNTVQVFTHNGSVSTDSESDETTV